MLQLLASMKWQKLIKVTTTLRNTGCAFHNAPPPQTHPLRQYFTILPQDNEGNWFVCKDRKNQWLTDLQIVHLVFTRSLWLRACKKGQGPTLPFRKFNKGIVISYFHMKSIFHTKWMKPKQGSCMSQLQASINIEIKVKTNTNILMPMFF